MPRPLKFGRARQSPKEQRVDRPHTGFPSQIFTGAITPEGAESSDNNFPAPSVARASRPEPAAISRTIGSAGGRLLPSSSTTEALPQDPEELSSTGNPSLNSTGALIPETVELPRILTVGGFLYQRIDVDPRVDMTMTSIGQQGRPGSASTPLLHQRPDRLPHLDRGCSQDWSSSGAQLDHPSAKGGTQRIGHGSRQQSIQEQNVSQFQQTFESDLAATQDEATEIQHDSRILRNTQAISYGSMSIGLQLTDVHSTQSAERKPKRKSKMLRELEPHNESPEPESEPEPKVHQPTTAGSSQPAQPRQKGKSRTLRELEDCNKSPEPDSDSEQEIVRPKTRRSSQPAVSTPGRKSNLLREIEPYNLSPEPESELDIETREFLTRSARKDFIAFVKGKPPTPRKNLNLRALMLAQFSGLEEGTKTFYTEDNGNLTPSSYQKQQELRKGVDFRDDEEDEEEDWSKIIQTVGRYHPQRISTRRTIARQVGNSAEDSQLNQKLAAELVWSTWDKQKEKINEHIRAPRYNPNPSQQELDAQGRRKPAYHVTSELPEGFQASMRMEEGLHVFIPTAAAFLDFGRFLKDVEEIAGRKMGVVKVIVPSECLSQTPSSTRSNLPRSPVVKTIKVNISLSKVTTEEPPKLYNILTTNGSTSLGTDEWLGKIQQDRNNLTKIRAISKEATTSNNAWKESLALQPYSERRMILRSQKQDVVVVCALNEPATPILRAALRCKDPNIENFLGNRFASSRSTQPGINKSVFHIAGSPGPLSPLQMNKYAAYSINYHHSGAPRILKVTLPEHHARLEMNMYISQHNGTLFGRPPKPPTCSQFVAHQPMYVPHATLSSYKVDCTEVVQHQGEMVITFPYAYHQAYASGPNITEEILYASDRCRTFHRENLYQHCSGNCTAGEPDDFDLKAVFNTLSSTGSSHRLRSRLESPSTSLSPPQSQEASTSQECDSDGHASKRISGLKAIDRVSDDGDWIDTSGQASRLKSNTNRKATRMTSNPYEPDMWDPDHAFKGSGDSADDEDEDDDDDDDEGSPIGGIRPRDSVTGRLLMPHECRSSRRKRDDESDAAPRKRSRRH